MFGLDADLVEQRQAARRRGSQNQFRAAGHGQKAPKRLT
jgi:hypothetical protein